MKDNIILIGYMGCGKTTIGKQLADLLKYRFLDTDQMIEKAKNDTISHMFEFYGETYFRKLETKTIHQLVKETNHCVIATGGGLPIQKENVPILQQLGLVIFLKVSAEDVYERLKTDTQRPLLQTKNPKEKIKEMLEFRNPLYEKAAHVIIDETRLTQENIIEEIVKQKRIWLERKSE